jgi:hypothetical protein
VVRAMVQREWMLSFGVLALVLSVIAGSVSILAPATPGELPALPPTPTQVIFMAAPAATPTPLVEIRD